MTSYFVNSDAVSNENESYHSEWIDRGIAVTSGGSEYREQIDSMPKGSTIFLHGRGFGIVGAGTVLDDQSASVRRGAGTVSPSEDEEFHRKVAWFADLRKNPLPYKEVIRIWGTNPRLAVHPIVNNGIALLDLVQAYAEQADIEIVRKRQLSGPTNVDALVQARRGQGQYRKDMLKLWQGRCAVTDCGVAAVLRASHALPWCLSTDQQRLDVNNGLLLTATLDALFDRGLIGFNDDGSMVCSPHLQPVDRKLLNIPTPLQKQLNPAQQQYLRDHRRIFGL
jgi:putative restriction endonuclease